MISSLVWKMLCAPLQLSAVHVFTVKVLQLWKSGRRDSTWEYNYTDDDAQSKLLLLLFFDFCNTRCLYIPRYYIIQSINCPCLNVKSYNRTRSNFIKLGSFSTPASDIGSFRTEMVDDIFYSFITLHHFFYFLYNIPRVYSIRLLSLLWRTRALL